MRSNRLYNVIFPIWVILFAPGWMWVWLLPANYVVDTIVTWFSLRKEENAWKQTFRVSWMICLIGFLCDCIGGVLLAFAAYPGQTTTDGWFFKNISYPLRTNLFSSFYAILFVLLAVLFTGILIFVLDKKYLQKQVDNHTAHKTALYLAILTAPYLFLLPPMVGITF